MHLSDVRSLIVKRVAVVATLTFLLIAVAGALPAKAATLDITPFPLPNTSSYPDGITSGPDGNLWFTESNADKIGRMTPGGTLTEFPVLHPPGEITSGPDGNLWFTGFNYNLIGRITPTGNVTLFPLASGASPAYITSGPDGNLWFTQSFGNSGSSIGRITPSGSVTEFPLPRANSYPKGITAGPDGNLWFTEPNVDQIGRITPSGSLTEFPVSTGSLVKGITAGPDGNLWFTEYGSNKIGLITPSGSVAELSLPAGTRNPSGITAGRDGTLWFTEWGDATIGQITTDGAITEFPISGARSLDSITSGPDGNIWFADFYASVIYRVNMNINVNATLTVTPTSLYGTFGTGGPCKKALGLRNQNYICKVTLTETAGSQGNLTWSARADIVATFSPSGGTLSPGQSSTVSISNLNCGAVGTLTFWGGQNPVTVAWQGGDCP
jgi:streptogramin lyase